LPPADWRGQASKGSAFRPNFSGFFFLRGKSENAIGRLLPWDAARMVARLASEVVGMAHGRHDAERRTTEGGVDLRNLS
jgi:hypothetical protein